MLATVLLFFRGDLACASTHAHMQMHMHMHTRPERAGRADGGQLRRAALHLPHPRAPVCARARTNTHTHKKKKRSFSHSLTLALVPRFALFLPLSLSHCTAPSQSRGPAHTENAHSRSRTLPGAPHTRRTRTRAHAHFSSSFFEKDLFILVRGPALQRKLLAQSRGFWKLSRPKRFAHHGHTETCLYTL